MRVLFDGFNGVIPQAQDIIGTITTNIGLPNMRSGWHLISIARLKSHTIALPSALRGRGEEYKHQLELNATNAANAITSVAKDSLITEIYAVDISR